MVISGTLTKRWEALDWFIGSDHPLFWAIDEAMGSVRLGIKITVYSSVHGATFPSIDSLIDITTGHLVDTTSDTVLLDQLRGGNSNGLALLYTRYHERVLRYCIRLMNDRQKAQDIVQNVFLKLHSACHTIRDGQTIQSWLFTVARNEAYTELGRKKPIKLDDSILWDGEMPDDELIMKERKEILDAVLQRLHLPYREVIQLRVYEQLSYEEIANITCTTVSSVKSRLFKARKALVQKLHPYFTERRL